MPNPLFDSQLQSKNQGIFGLINQIKGGGAEQLFNQMYQSNPQFRDFANSMKGKTPEQAFKERGLDFNSFKNMMN